MATIEDATKESSTATHLVDSDVHEMMLDVKQLLPYLEPVWQRWLGEYAGPFFGTNMVNNGWPYTVPGPGARVDWIQPGGPIPASTVEIMREHLLEGEGVTVAILNGLCHFSAFKGNYDYAAALASAYTQWQVEEWLEKEPCLRGSIHVVAHDPEKAAREVDRWAKHPQLVQVFLPTVTDRQYGDPQYWPIFEAAARNNLPVAFHHANHTQTVLGYPRTFMEWHTTAAPQAAQNQIMSLICNGVFEKFPTLKTVFLEASVGWVPWFLARLDQQFREMRPEVPWLKRLPSEYFREHVRVATQPLSDIKPGEFARLAEETETENVYVFSVDYPHYDADSADVVLPRTLPEELRLRVRYKNAAETYPKLAYLAG